MLIEQLMDVEKVKKKNLKIRTKNLKFRRDLQDLVRDSWSVAQ